MNQPSQVSLTQHMETLMVEDSNPMTHGIAELAGMIKGMRTTIYELSTENEISMKEMELILFLQQEDRCDRVGRLALKRVMSRLDSICIERMDQLCRQLCVRHLIQTIEVAEVRQRFEALKKELQDAATCLFYMKQG